MNDNQLRGETPTVVALYAWGTGQPVRAAEFRLTQDRVVELDIINPDEAGLARQFYERGVDVDDDRRTVLPGDEPEVFMRGLLTPRRMSYYNFTDESPGAERPE